MVRECFALAPAVAALTGDAVYWGDLDLTKLRPSCRVYPVSEPIERAWTDEQQTTKQPQSWLVTVSSATEGESYTATVLGADATHEAQPGDDKAAIRDAEIGLIEGLGKPVTVASVGLDQLRITGNTAGQHLGVAVTSNMTASIEVDTMRRQNIMPSWWTLRFEFEEQPAVDGTPSRAPAWSTRLRGYLQAGLADAVLRAAHLDFNSVVARSGFTRSDRGKTTVVEFLDVQFSALQGLGFDLPGIESFGTAPTTEITP